MPTAELDLVDLEKIMATWSPDAKARALEAINARATGDQRVWYCASPGRRCDGKPHGDYNYPHARADQWPPPGNNWLVWFLKSGRGAGKTRSGSEWTRKVSEKVPQIALVGRRGIDVRSTMIEGTSGLIYACETAGIGYDWKPSVKEFTFANGAKVFGYSAEEPDSLRGREHGAAWLDEPAHMPLIVEVWDNLSFTLRLPGMPGGAKILCTSTPLPSKWIKETIKEPGTVTVTVSTYANLDNLDPGMRQRILAKYEGTRKGRQELEGEILEDVEGALWQDGLLRRSDYDENEVLELFGRRVVAIDPAGTANRKSDQTGIVSSAKYDGEYYVLGDVSGTYTPQGWARAAIKEYLRIRADAIVAEVNFGADMVETTILAEAKEMGVEVRVIKRRAQRSKELRAEPIVGKYEQKHVYHNGKFADLEEEMLTWVPGTGPSPNRIDALVWGLDELFGNSGPAKVSSPAGRGSLPARGAARGPGRRVA